MFTFTQASIARTLTASPRLAEELAHPASIGPDLPVAVAEQRTRPVGLVLPDHDVLLHLLLEVADQRGAEPARGVRAPELHRVGATHVRGLLVDGRRGIHHQGVEDPREA